MNPLFVRDHLGLYEGESYSKENITDALSNLYGTGYFQYVDYKLEWRGNKNILVIRIKEKSETLFKVGINYDSDYQTALPFNFTSFNF